MGNPEQRILRHASIPNKLCVIAMATIFLANLKTEEETLTRSFVTEKISHYSNKKDFSHLEKLHI